MEMTTNPRPGVTFAEAVATRRVPVLIPVGGQGDLAPQWWDEGDEPLDDLGVELVEKLSRAREWAAGTTVRINGALGVPDNSGANPRMPLSRGAFFDGYGVEVIEPGQQRRTATLSTMGSTVSVGPTSTENAARIAADRAEYLASRSPQLVALEELRDAEVARRRLKTEAERVDEVLRDKVRAALTAGMSVADVARVARLSRERIYQIRDGRR